MSRVLEGHMCMFHVIHPTQLQLLVYSLNTTLHSRPQLQGKCEYPADQRYVVG